VRFLRPMVQPNDETALFTFAVGRSPYLVHLWRLEVDESAWEKISLLGLWYGDPLYKSW